MPGSPGHLAGTRVPDCRCGGAGLPACLWVGWWQSGPPGTPQPALLVRGKNPAQDCSAHSFPTPVTSGASDCRPRDRGQTQRPPCTTPRPLPWNLLCPPQSLGTQFAKSPRSRLRRPTGPSLTEGPFLWETRGEVESPRGPRARLCGLLPGTGPLISLDIGSFSGDEMGLALQGPREGPSLAQGTSPPASPLAGQDQAPVRTRS